MSKVILPYPIYLLSRSVSIDVSTFQIGLVNSFCCHLSLFILYFKAMLSPFLWAVGAGRLIIWLVVLRLLVNAVLGLFFISKRAILRIFEVEFTKGRIQALSSTLSSESCSLGLLMKFYPSKEYTVGAAVRNVFFFLMVSSSYKEAATPCKFDAGSLAWLLL